MGHELNPIVLDHVLQSLIATQSCQATFSSQVFYFAAHHVVHSELLEGFVLEPNLSELAIDLPHEEGFFESFEGKIIELADFEVSFDEPGVLVGFEFDSKQFDDKESANFDEQSGYVECEEVDYFIDGGGACDEVASHEFEYFDEFI